MAEYFVDAFIPQVPAGCGTKDLGWDRVRCEQFSAFLNHHAGNGWKLHSSEYRQVTVQSGCGGPTTGTWLVCIFER